MHLSISACAVVVLSVCRAARALQHSDAISIERMQPQLRAEPQACSQAAERLPKLVSYKAASNEMVHPRTSIPSAPLEACNRSVNQPAPQRRSADFDAPGQPKKAARTVID